MCYAYICVFIKSIFLYMTTYSLHTHIFLHLSIDRYWCRILCDMGERVSVNVEGGELQTGGARQSRQEGKQLGKKILRPVKLETPKMGHEKSRKKKAHFFVNSKTKDLFIDYWTNVKRLFQESAWYTIDVNKREVSLYLGITSLNEIRSSRQSQTRVYVFAAWMR